jgi:hypothetical protein
VAPPPGKPAAKQPEKYVDCIDWTQPPVDRRRISVGVPGHVEPMPRRPAQVTQADIARVIRAAKQAGAAEVVVKIGEQSLIVRLGPSDNPQKGLEPEGEIIL